MEDRAVAWKYEHFWWRATGRWGLTLEHNCVSDEYIVNYCFFPGGEVERGMVVKARARLMMMSWTYKRHRGEG